MAKLTKAQLKAHREAEAILTKDRLNEDEKLFVLDNWHEGANFTNDASGAFFTPADLASDFAIEAGSGRIIDLCAGIGTLSYHIYDRHRYNPQQVEITCVEINPRYVEIGKKILPEARWICADVFDWREWWLKDLKGELFETAVSNPPFSKVRRSGSAPRYSGSEFEFHVIDIAAEMAKYGTFIVPQQSANFRYSGAHFFDWRKDGRAVEFCKTTGWQMNAGIGIDCSIFKDQWKDTSIITEVVNFDYGLDREEHKAEIQNREAILAAVQPFAAQQLALI